MDQRYVDLAAAMVRQAFADAAHDYHHPRHMAAARWLELAGLVDADGTTRYGTPIHRHAPTTSTIDENTRRRWARARMKEA
ncbi:MAG TPA: hypothetical protein VEZ12_19665 [Herpetosiphonaceae bacterium]|nr:hypothetical protein [Herpetosiphonaceae bacterium]